MCRIRLSGIGPLPFFNGDCEAYDLQRNAPEPSLSLFYGDALPVTISTISVSNSERSVCWQRASLWRGGISKRGIAEAARFPGANETSEAIVIYPKC